MSALLRPRSVMSEVKNCPLFIVPSFTSNSETGIPNSNISSDGASDSLGESELILKFLQANNRKTERKRIIFFI